MDAVILAAGLGTRLRPHTERTPKPLLPIQGRPILDWTLGALPPAVDRVLLVVGLLTRPAAAIAFLYLGSLWISEWGTAWIWELLVPVLASLALAIGRAGRRWGIDARLAQRWPSSPWW